jgi:hypothetical protein
MNVAHTALAAYTVTPNTQPSVRSQRSWYTSAQAPEKKNRKQSTGRTIRPDADFTAPFYSPSIACYTARPDT